MKQVNNNTTSTIHALNKALIEAFLKNHGFNYTITGERFDIEIKDQDDKIHFETAYTLNEIMTILGY